jgi:hypothetical protein
VTGDHLSYRWDCGNHPELPSPGRSDGEPFPSPRTTTYLCLELPAPAGTPRTTGPGTSGCYSTCHPGQGAARSPAVICTGSSSSATSTRLPSLSTPGTLPETATEIYSTRDSFSGAAVSCTRTAARRPPRKPADQAMATDPAAQASSCRPSGAHAAGFDWTTSLIVVVALRTLHVLSFFTVRAIHSPRSSRRRGR